MTTLFMYAKHSANEDIQ